MTYVDEKVNNENDHFVLSRFTIAQKNIYGCVLTELIRGKKQTSLDVVHFSTD